MPVETKAPKKGPPNRVQVDLDVLVGSRLLEIKRKRREESGLSVSYGNILRELINHAWESECQNGVKRKTEKKRK